MPDTSIQTTTRHLARFYAIGFLTVTVIIGFITLLARFLAHVNTT